MHAIVAESCGPLVGRLLGFACLSPALHVDALLGVALQIPAGRVSSTRKQGVDAGLDFRRIEDELGLAIFLRHGVVAGHRELSVGLVIRGHAMAEHGVVDGVGESGHAEHGGHSNDDELLQEVLDSGSLR
jgi:hypothetical protein